MDLRFTWDPVKAAANVRKHRVSFTEAATAFADPRSITIPDPDHSRDEERFVLIGRSDGDRLLVVAHTGRGDLIRISVHAHPAAASGTAMKKKPSRKSTRAPARERDIMRPEYDFSKGVRNKYAARLKPGSQIVVLDPDVAAAFGDAKAVNRALRMLLDVMPARPAPSSRRRTA